MDYPYAISNLHTLHLGTAAHVLPTSASSNKVLGPTPSKMHKVSVQMVMQRAASAGGDGVPVCHNHRWADDTHGVPGSQAHVSPSLGGVSCSNSYLLKLAQLGHIPPVHQAEHPNYLLGCLPDPHVPPCPCHPCLQLLKSDVRH